MFVDWKNQYFQNAIPSKTIYRFNAVPKNYQWHFFIELEQKKHLKIFMEIQKTPNSQINSEKAKQSWKNQVP